MGIVIKYSDPNGIEEPATLVSLGSNARYGTLSFTNAAATGETGVSSITLEDPGGIYSFVGLRAFDVRESSAPSNNSVIGRFAIQGRQVARSPEHGLITGSDREWTLDLVDYNWHLGKRILTDADAKRPDETAGDRIRWLLQSAAHFALYDYGYVSYPTDQMEANDYRGQRPLDLLADCAIESGYNFWCDFNEAHGRPELFFLSPGSATYASTLRISNLLSDVDSTVTFAPYEDAALSRSASRIAYGAYLAYDGGAVYVRKDSTGEQFAKIDQSAPMSNVKRQARARRIANHFLNDNDEESDIISCAIKVPVAQVNDIRHGQLIDVRFQHLPGYADVFTPMRVLRRTVIQEEEGGTDHYRIRLELAPAGRDAAVADYAGIVFAGVVRYDDDLTPDGYAFTQDNPPAGWDVQAATGPIAIDQASQPFTSITVSANMTVRIHARVQISGVEAAGTYTLTVTVNGDTVGSDAQLNPGGFWATTFEVDLRDYELTSGDTVSVTATPAANWTTVGTNDTYLRVGRGTFVWDSETWVGP